MLDFVWSNSKDDFKASENSLTQQQIDFLNTHYIAIGTISVDDNTNIVVYFDENKQFGAVWYCQDDSVIFDHLDLLLEITSNATYVIPVVGGNPLNLSKPISWV